MTGTVQTVVRQARNLARPHYVFRPARVARLVRTRGGESLDERRFRDYESVCRGVEPSWADNKQQLD